MEIKEKTINKVKYTFICQYYETATSWGHKVKLLQNGYEIARQKIRYYNRTWERYTFQSCMNSCVNIAYNNGLETHIFNYKDEHGKRRITKAEKEQLQKEYNKTDNGKRLLKLKKLVNGNGHDFKNKYYNMDF